MGRRGRSEPSKDLSGNPVDTDSAGEVQCGLFRLGEESDGQGATMDLEDKVIICADCKKEFTHTVEDQKRYTERGFSQDPKRCRECRQARKDKATARKDSRPAIPGRRRVG